MLFHVCSPILLICYSEIICSDMPNRRPFTCFRHPCPLIIAPHSAANTSFSPCFRVLRMESPHLIMASDFDGGILERIRQGEKLSHGTSLRVRIMRALDNSNNNDFSFITLKIVKKSPANFWRTYFSELYLFKLFSDVGDRRSGSIHGHGQTPREGGE